MTKPLDILISVIVEFIYTKKASINGIKKQKAVCGYKRLVAGDLQSISGI
jgi:hypothetical protein